jgi:putative transposase
MARLPRYVIPGLPQHVIQRGNNRQAIFVAEGDYAAYLGWLKEAAQRYGLLIHAYVLMTNHVHLLVTPTQDDSVAKTLQSLGRRYVQYFNFTYQRTGTLWEGRYRATVVDAEDYLLACCRYIEMNPVRAGMVKSAAHYRWSSYRHNAQGHKDAQITDHDVYRRLGRTVQARYEAYRSLFRDGDDDTTVLAIRESAHKGWALGGDRFRGEVEKLAKRRTAPLQRGRPKARED